MRKYNYSGIFQAVPGTRSGSPPGDVDVAARILAALLGLQEQAEPSDDDLNVYREALSVARTVFIHPRHKEHM